MNCAAPADSGPALAHRARVGAKCLVDSVDQHQGPV